jgi:2-dehydro-3-deoxygluconokinase
MSQTLALRPAADCRWDAAALGEVMLRFDPGEGRVRNARSFQVWEGGGEYNVVRALAKVFGQRATVVTALPDNDVGRLALDLIQQGGVDPSHIIWRDWDGVGRNTRVGLNFTERGFGVRPPLGVSDRGHSAASQIVPGEVDWSGVLGGDGVRWLHTGGIFAALAPQTPAVALEAVKAARQAGTVVSFDLNYRASLWKSLGDPAETQRLMREIAAHVDVMFGDAAGFRACLGHDGPAEFEAFADAAARAFPNFKVLASTERAAASATSNDWSACLWTGGKLHRAQTRHGLEILDRVGGGDAFAAGVIYALTAGLGPQAAVDYGAAHGALAMTTPGDGSMADLKEVEALVIGGSGHAIR